MKQTELQTIEIKVSRTIAASPAEIYDTWLDPNRPGSPWFGVARAIVQASVGGLFYHAVHFEGREWAHYGRFIVLDRPRCIEHTWMSEATRGIESVVTLTLEADGGQTRVQLCHRGVPDDALGRSHQEGWSSMLDAIVERFDHKP